MSKKRENGPENSDVPSGGDEVVNLSPRLSVQLDDQGAIAWDRMRSDTREKLKGAIERSGLSVPSATAAGPKAAVVESFPPEMAGVIYDSLSMLLMGLAQRGGYTAHQAAVLGFTADEKRSLVPATVNVLNKYNTSLGKYQEEIMLGVLLVTITSGKIALLKKTTPVINIVRETPAQPESQADI